MDAAFFDSVWFTYLILPFLIFLSRILDVSLDTLRIVFISKGNKIVAPVLGFFQVLIWIIAITKVMQNLNNITCYIAYAGGFAVGNYIGLIIEEKLAIGIQLIRIITHKDSSTLINNLRKKGYTTTAIEAQGKSGLVHVIYLMAQRSKIKSIIDIINEYNPKAFFSIEDIRAVNQNNELLNIPPKTNLIQWMRRGK